MLTLETRNVAENRIAANQFDGPYSTKIKNVAWKLLLPFVVTKQLWATEIEQCPQLLLGSFKNENH